MADIFTALKKVFSTGLIVSDFKNDSIKIIDTQRTQAYTRRNSFMTKLHRNQLYQSTLAQNYSINRLALYRDYDMMDADPILASALDIYVFESLTKDEYGNILKITSDDDQIVDTLRLLFYLRLNCLFTFSVWFRNFVKYGDFFLALRIDDEHGIIGCLPISSYDILRILDDRDNPDTYFFKFTAGGDLLIDNYNIAHFRLLTDTNFLPYGRSILLPARRIWKNLSLMIDAMMIQRIMRAPERRVFKIDVGDLPNELVGPFMKDVIDKMKKIPYKDPNTGLINLKYNIQNLLLDFFIPVRGKEDGSSVLTLAGMLNSMILDINFVKGYMMAALKIPKAFLTFELGILAKATLSSLDIIFSRLILNLQNLFINELYRIALIHLFIMGFTDLDDINFKLELHNPSNVKQIQLILLWKQRLELGTAMELSGQFSLNFIYDNIYLISPEDAKLMLKQIVSDKKYRAKLELISQGNLEHDNYNLPKDSFAQLQGYNGIKDLDQLLQLTMTGLERNPLEPKFKGNSPLNQLK